MNSFSKSNFNFYFDSKGYPQAKISSPHEILGEYLMADVQSNPIKCEELIGVVDNIQAEELETWDGVGNGFLLVLDRKQAIISYEFTDDKKSTTVPLSIFRDALIGWMQLIKSK